MAEELEALDPNDSKAKFNRGWFLINQGKLQEGFQCLEHGRALKVYGSGKINTTKPIWDQSDLKGKTVILSMECGFGDQMIYARFATEIWKRGGKCIMCCEKLLHPLFLRIPGVKAVSKNHLRAHETKANSVGRFRLEKNKPHLCSMY